MKTWTLTTTEVVGLSLVLAGHIVFAFLYQWLIPLGYGPDEPRHYGYIQHLILYKALPRLGDPSHPYYCHIDPRPPHAIGIHPPLYYVLLSPVYGLLAGRRIDHPNAAQTPFEPLPPSRSHFVQRVLRTCSLLMALGTLLFVARIALAFSCDFWWLLGVVGFVAWLPHFLLLSAVMNNDAVTILLGHLFLWLLVRQVLSPDASLSDAVRVGTLFGLLGLAKASALSWLPLLLAVTWLIARQVNPVQRFKVIVIALLTPALLCGWWYVRFYALYGRIMPIVKWTENPELLLHSPMELFSADAGRLTGRFLTGVVRSLWGQVDWFLLKPEHIAAWRQKFRTPKEAAYPFTELLWWLLLLLTLAAFVGWLIRTGQWWRERKWTSLHTAGAFLVAAFGLLLLALWHYTLFTHPGGYEGGRYLLPSIGAFAFLFWQGLFGLVPSRFRSALVLAVLTILLALNVGCVVNLSEFLNPLYASVK